MSNFRKYIRTLEKKKNPPIEQGHPILVKYKESTANGIISRIEGKRIFFFIMNQWELPFEKHPINYWESEFNFETGKEIENNYIIYEKTTGKTLKEYLNV